MGLFTPLSSQPFWSCRFKVAARNQAAIQWAKQEPLQWRVNKPEALGSGQTAWRKHFDLQKEPQNQSVQNKTIKALLEKTPSLIF